MCRNKSLLEPRLKNEFHGWLRKKGLNETTYSQNKISIFVKGLIALRHQNVDSYISMFQLGQTTVIMNFNSFTHTEY